MLVGREPQIAALAELSGRARSGAQIALIVGDEGAGKTVLAETVLVDAPRVARVELTAADQSIPLSAVGLLLSALGRSPSQDAPVALLQAIGDAGPLVVLIDDAHWLDDRSQGVLWQVIRQVDELPVLVVATATTEQNWFLGSLSRLARRPERGAVIALGPLATADIGDYLQQRLGVRLDMATLRQVQAATGGYPMFLVAFADSLVGHGWRAKGVAQAIDALPALTRDGGLAARLAATLDTLSAPDRASVVALALGGELSDGQLGRVLDLQGYDQGSLAELVRNGLVEVTSSGSVRLRHAIMARVIASDASHAEKLAAHRALAVVVPGLPGLVHRVEAADLLAADDLIADLTEQFALASERGDFAFAFELSGTAARLRPEFLLDGALAAARAGRVDLMARQSQRYSELPASQGRTAIACLLSLEEGDFADALRLFAQIEVPGVRDVRELLLVSHALLALCAVIVLHGAYELSPPTITLVRDALRATPAVALSLDGMQASLHATMLDAWLGLLGAGPQEHRTQIQRLTQLRASLGDSPADALASVIIRHLIGSLRVIVGELRLAEAELSADRSEPDVKVELVTGLRLAQLRFWNGDWDEAYSLADASLRRAMSEQVSLRGLQAFAMAALVPLARGEVELAENLLAMDDPANTTSIGAAAAGVTRVWGAVSSGGHDRLVADVLDGIWATGAADWVAGLPMVVLRVRAHAALGELDAARRALAVLAREGWNRDVADYLRAHGSALIAGAEGDVAEASGQFGLARAALVRQLDDNPRGGLRLFAAVLAEDAMTLGVAHPEAWDPAAFADVDEAVRLLGQCGATAWRDRLADLASRLRVEVSRPDDASRLLGQLTTREREIALLVGAGLTNRQIAQRLFITVRTAEYHVFNALQKLGMRSRVQLRRALGEASGG